METAGRPLSEIPAINRFLSYCRIRTVPSKTVLIHAGDVPDVLYFVIKGSVEVLIDGEVAGRWAIWREEKASRLRDDRGKGVSSIAVFDAMNLQAGPLALAHLSHRVPAGFHGNWRDAAG